MGEVFAEVANGDLFLKSVQADDVMKVRLVGTAGNDGNLKTVIFVVGDQLVKDFSNQVAAFLNRVEA